MTPEEFWNTLHNAPLPKPVFYRLYYKPEDGSPLFYSMEDLPGTYIEIDHEAYQRADSLIRVKNGKIVPVTWKTTAVLIPGSEGTPCDPRDVAVVVSHDNNIRWSKHTYES